jgi:hypothetical protein
MWRFIPRAGKRMQERRQRHADERAAATTQQDEREDAFWRLLDQAHRL